MNVKKISGTQSLASSAREDICYRRPGIISGPDRLVCYYEEQIVSEPKIQTLVCRVSTDKGISWGKPIVLAKGGATGMLHNIMMVYEGGMYHCLWNIQYRQLWHSTSTDAVNWTAPVDLTRKIWRADSEYEFNAFGIGSGHGIVLDNGTILIPTWFTTGGDGHKPSAFACIWTNDGFETLHVGKPLADGNEIKNPNEGAIAIVNGRVFATVRHDNTVRARAVTESPDGIENWSDPVFRTDLPDPICHASLLTAEDRLFFCNCNNSDEDHEENFRTGKSKFIFSEDSRKNLTVRESLDGGKTFDEGLAVAEKAGYSDLAYSDGMLFCIYECGWNEKQSCIFPHEIAISEIKI